MTTPAPIPRVEGPDKIAGRARYIDDLVFPDMLHGLTIRSTIPRGRIRAIRYDPSIPWDEFTIVTAADIPGKNVIAHVQQDQPCLADREVRHVAEPILLLAHPDREMLRRAAAAVAIEYEELAACLDVRLTGRPEFLQFGEDNTFSTVHIVKGNVEEGFEAADLILDDAYETGAQEQAYIEPQGMIARPAPEGPGVEIHGSLQCPYFVVHAVAPMLALEPGQVRVVQTTTGGAFGGKEDYPSVIAGHAALLALKSRRPVKVVYDRTEDILATTKRHPSLVNIKAGVTREGRLLALEIDIVMDGGAYVTLSPVVLSRGALHAAGPYACPHVRIRARARLTNTPPHGAFRGFGVPQTAFAIERHMDRLARTLGLDPLRFRAMNYLRDGDTMATGQLVRDHVDLSAMADATYERLGGAARQAEIDRFNASQPHKRRAFGFSAFNHGAGFTGSGEERLASRVAVQLAEDGRVEVLTANTEIGQGAITVFSRIAADVLGLEPAEILVAVPDTSRVPNSGPTVASRTTMIVGRLIEMACLDLAAQMMAEGGGDADGAANVGRGAMSTPDPPQAPLLSPLRGDAFRSAARAALKAGQRPVGHSQYRKPPYVNWDEKTYRGDAYGTYAWAVYGCEVEVDLRTGEARVLKFVANQEVGRVVHPVLARGQIQGGVVQGIGWALCEKVIYDKGRVANTALSTYVIPTFVDAPPIEVLFAEVPFPYGPRGAKGIGELPMDGPAPAVVNAISRAIGAEVNHVPCLPEDLLELIDG